jgi:AMP nucleosidase
LNGAADQEAGVESAQWRMPYMPPFVAPARFTDAAAALAHVQTIYQEGLAHLRESMLRFVAGETLPGRVRACYPFVRVHTHTVARQSPATKP